MYHQPPTVKGRDTRCSINCCKNWTKYNQKQPIGHYCSCQVHKSVFKVLK